MLTIPKPAPIWKSEADIRSLVQSARRAKASLLAILTDIDTRVGRRRDELNRSLSDLDMKSRLRAVDARSPP